MQIWNHPDVLYLAANKQKKTALAIDDTDIDEIDDIAEKKINNGSLFYDIYLN